MRRHSGQLAAVITEGSFSLEVTADVMYGQTRVFQDLPLADWAFSGEFDANVKTRADATVAYQGDMADSLTPREFEVILAPAGQELRMYSNVSAGPFNERVAMGVYRIDDVLSAQDRRIPFAGRRLTVGSVVELRLIDRFDAVDAAPFRSWQQPASLASAWAEVARVSRLQVTRTVPDQPIPRSLVYARSRLDTVQQLAAVLGGRALMLADGTLGVAPDAFGAPAVVLTSGEPAGTIIGAGYALSSAGVRNVVVGDFEDDAGNPIHVEEEVTQGPFATSGPFGERVDFYPENQKNFIRSVDAARTAVKNRLALVSRRAAAEVPVKLVPGPRLELGDVVRLRREDEDVTGRVVSYRLARNQEMTVTVRT